MTWQKCKNARGAQGADNEQELQMKRSIDFLFYPSDTAGCLRKVQDCCNCFWLELVIWLPIANPKQSTFEFSPKPFSSGYARLGMD